jgi:hypothetical protein
VGNIWGGQKILDFLGKLHNKVKIDARNELINRALLEPETAKFLLTPLKEKGLAEKIKEFTTNKSYMLVPILSSKEEENE